MKNAAVYPVRFSAFDLTALRLVADTLQLSKAETIRTLIRQAAVRATKAQAIRIVKNGYERLPS